MYKNIKKGIKICWWFFMLIYKIKLNLFYVIVVECKKFLCWESGLISDYFIYFFLIYIKIDID